jgi:D-alanine-D-alanine ligase
MHFNTGKMAPSIVVLYNHSTRLIKGDPRDLVAEQGVIACAQAVAEALQATGYRVVQVPIHTDVESALAFYPPTDWVIFNLTEGMEGRLFEEARVAWALDAMGYRFTGNDGDALALSLNKARAKECLVAAGVPVPPGRVFRHPAEVTPETLTGLAFPLIVKPVAESASFGIGLESVVHTVPQLRDRVSYVVERYREAALVEAFIVGREFNVALWSPSLETGGNRPEALPLAEIDFSTFADPCARMVPFAAKWEPDSFEHQHTPVLCPAPVDPALGDHIIGTAQRAWSAIGCRGYVRVDMRLADDGTPYVVEVNCNPDLSPDAGFYRSARVAGYEYVEMVVRILEPILEATPLPGMSP